MEDVIRMDSHKLIYHPHAVVDWLSGRNIYPIELEISPSNACNHRCTFCAVDYLGYKSTTLPKDIILKNIKLLASKGLKSVIYSGEGEPLVNKDMTDIINGTKHEGVDAAMSTNGVLLDKSISKAVLKSLTWIRFSVSAARGDTYHRIHRGRPDDLDRVLCNLADAVEVKRSQRLETTLGVQILLIQDNKHEVVELAKKTRDIGVDYFTVKPYSHHPLSNNDQSVDYKELAGIGEELKSIETERYKVYFRANAMKKLYAERGYKKCYGLPFMSHIDAEGNVWPCIAHIGKDGYSYGNLHEKNFLEIWEGEERKKVSRMFDEMDLDGECRELCRLDEINRYLNDLKHPGGHVNFI